MVNEKERYEMAGTTHRYFLGWRHAAFAGYIVGAFAALSLALQSWEKSQVAAALVLLAASPIGVALFFADIRIRQLYNDAVQAGKALETAEKVDAGGVFTNLARPNSERTEPDPGWGTHTIVAAAVYFGCSITLFAGGIAVLICR